MSIGRILGSEHELGIELRNIPNRFFDSAFFDEEKEIDRKISFRDNYLSEKLPFHCFNGGYIYQDCRHPEICTPETDNLFDAVRYELAMQRECLEVFGDKYKPLFYKNNVDSTNSTFGSHENYSLNRRNLQLEELLPLGVSEKIITGSGNIYNGESFEITQRARFMTCSIGTGTTADRTIINTRNQERSFRCNEELRFHHISNDALMGQNAILLKRLLMVIGLSLLETNATPKLNYRGRTQINGMERAVIDLRNISKQTSDWRMEGMPLELYSPITVMEIYYRAFTVRNDTTHLELSVLSYF